MPESCNDGPAGGRSNGSAALAAAGKVSHEHGIPVVIDAEDPFDAAISAYNAADLTRAEELCRALLSAEPDNADALNLLGVVLQDHGCVEESVAVLSRATEVDPTFSDAFGNLARAFRFMNRLDQAVAAAARATELDPSFGEGWRQLGFALATLNRNEEAIPALRKAIAQFPESAELHVAMALGSRAVKDLPGEATAWREVLRLNPERTDALVALGTVLTEMNELAEAAILLRRATAQMPEDIVALEALARNAHRRFDGDELVSACRRILARYPERLDILGMMSNGQLWLGQFDELKKTREAVLAVQPENRSFAQQVGAVVPGFMNQQEVDHSRAQLQDPALPINDRVNAGFALGKALERAGDDDAAFEIYLAANKLLHTAEAEANQSFDLIGLRQHIDDVRTRYTPALFTALRHWGNDSELPVFVAGMPRSGTSLVEQIAASHPRVFGAGERREIMEIVARLNRDKGFLWPSQWDVDEFGEEARKHVAWLQSMGGGADKVIDKLPDNIQVLGAIRVLFPNARIIVCRRDLRDVCVSCFTTHFGDPIPWSNDLAECAARAVEIERLTNFWLSVLPGACPTDPVRDPGA